MSNTSYDLDINNILNYKPSSDISLQPCEIVYNSIQILIGLNLIESHGLRIQFQEAKGKGIRTKRASKYAYNEHCKSTSQQLLGLSCERISKENPEQIKFG